MKHLIITAMVLLSAISIAAQEKPAPIRTGGQFRIGIGYQRTFIKDRQASPLRYQSSDKTLTVGYTKLSEEDLFNAEIKAAIGDLFPTGYRNRKWYHPNYQPDGALKLDSSRLKGTLYNSHIRIAYARNIGNGYTSMGGEDLNSYRYAGASLNSQLFYTDNIVRTGWMHAASVNADFMQISRLETRHYFSFRITIPLFSRNTRLPYHNTVSSADNRSGMATLFRQGTKWAWLGNFHNVRLDAGYEYGLSNHARLGLNYSGQLLHYEKEAPVTLFQNNVAINMAFQ